MKLLPVEYYGYADLDRRFTNQMLPWIVAEIKKKNNSTKVCLGVEDGNIQAYDTNFEQQFAHRARFIVRFAQGSCEGNAPKEQQDEDDGTGGSGDARSFLYVVKEPTQQTRKLQLHAFRAVQPEDVTELYNQIRQAGGSMSHLSSSPYGTPTSLSRSGSGPTVLTSNGGNGSNTTLTALCTDISPSSSHFFEVLYIGKIKVSHRRVPETFIDDALQKFQLHEQEKLRDHFRHLYDNRRGSQDSTTSDTGSNEGVPFVNQSNSALSSPSTPVESFQPFEVDQKTSPCNSGDEGSKSDSALGSSTSTVTSPTNIDIKVDQSETSNDSLDSDTDTSQTNPTVTRTRTVSESVADRKTITRSKTVDQLITSSKTMSKSFENVNSITKTAPKLDAPPFVQMKTGSTEALPTVAEDKDENPAQTKVGSFNKPTPSFAKRTRASSIGNGQILRHYSASSNGTEQQSTNRTMVFLVGRTDLRLISPDRKQILLHKQLRDVATCIQGVRNPDHFGFICREHSQECFMGYIFKCQSDSVAVDVVQAITQAFTATQRLSTNPSSVRDIPTYAPVAITTCEHCPLVWYQRLCAEVEGRDDRRTHTVIMRRVAQLDECDQALLTARLKESEVDTLKEQNELLMSLLRQHCEQKQNRHVHDTAENRSEFLNQYLGGSTIFMKAKRSLSNSFDHLLKRKGSRDDFGQALKDAAVSYARDSSPNPQTLDVPGQNDEGSNTPDGSRSRTSTISSGDDRPTDLPGSLKLEQPAKDDKQLKSPMMDIFLKVGSSSGKSGLSDESIINKPASWRQQMFNRAINPSKPAELSRGPSHISSQSTSTKRDRAELRALWKKAIHQALLLIRMEKENARLRARQEESAVKRIKLEYDEISPCQKGLMEMWEMLVTKESRITLKCDNQMLLQAVRQGVPRTKRGEVWNFLAHQFCLRAAPPDISEFPNYNAHYEVLLKQLTAHQHAILIDLGRTFPNHPYFSSPLGPGQLALFNLLKAYSLLDPEVGYCQGLSFIAGVLLLHMAEDEAFILLRHLMFRRGLRRQYLPDMQALQVRLYQLSRLLHDQLPDLYDHFDAHDVSTALYAAPWMLTLFASQFPLGFVTRVFDLLFLDSSDVLFRVALALLNHHHDKLLKCNSFEEIMDYLKATVPAIDKITLDKVMKQVLTTDVSKQLTEYRVEYHVLQEEMASVRPQLDLLSKLDAQNKDLVRQNNTLVEQLEIAMSNVNRLETTRSVHQATINRLESQARGLEVTVATLGSFINVLIERKTDIEVPGDVRRIVTQLALAQERRRGGCKQTNENVHPPNQKHLTKSLSMTKLGLGFGKTNKDVPMIRSSSVNVGLGQNLNNTPNNKIADPPIKFSGSRGFPLKVIDDDESYEDIKQEKNKQNLTTENQKQKSVPLTNKPYPLKTALSQPILGSQKSSGFFANSHMQIQQQRMNALALKQGVKDTLGAELQFIKDVTSGLDRNIIENTTKVLKDEYGKSLHPENEKSMSLPLSPYKGTTDSGIGTPVSPAKDCTMSQISPNKDCASDVPPLFDSDISFTYNGTTKLKSIRPLAAKQH